VGTDDPAAVGPARISEPAAFALEMLAKINELEETVQAAVNSGIEAYANLGDIFDGIDHLNMCPLLDILMNERMHPDDIAAIKARFPKVEDERDE
jgi:hypothetical protein